MGLLYCGANIEPRAAADLCDDGRCILWCRARGNFLHSMQYFEGLSTGLPACLVTGAARKVHGSRGKILRNLGRF